MESLGCLYRSRWFPGASTCCGCGDLFVEEGMDVGAAAMQCGDSGFLPQHFSVVCHGPGPDGRGVHPEAICNNRCFIPVLWDGIALPL